MIKSELIQKIADENPHLFNREALSNSDAERIVSTFFEQIAATLASGGRVELRGFGSFSVRHRDARIGRNPRSGERVQVTPKTVPFFKTGKGLRDRMNGG